MYDYPKEREALEAILKEDIGDCIHHCDIKMYNIYDTDFSIEVIYKGNRLCVLTYEKELDDVRMVSHSVLNELQFSEIFDESKSGGKKAKKLFLISEIILMSKDIREGMSALMGRGEYKEFVEKYK